MAQQEDIIRKDHFPKKVLSYKLSSNELTMWIEDNFSGQFKGTFTFFKEGMIRVRLFLTEFEPLPYDVVNQDAIMPEKCSLTETRDVLRIAFGGFFAEFGKEPFAFRVKNSDGEILYDENMKDVNSVGDGLDQVPPMGYSEEGKSSCLMNLAVKLRYDEHIYGLGEHFTEFDKRGQTVTMMNYDTLGCRDGHAYKNIPFYISSYRYGLFVHNHGIFDFNIGTESTASISIHVPDSQLEYYLIFGGSIKQILSSYMKLTGPAALPPDWSFGLWYSTGFKNNTRENSEADARQFRERKISCDVIHFDCYWLRDDMWCDFVWDGENYPDHVGMLKNLHEQGYKVCLWINPYVTIVSDMFREAESLGYMVKNKEGKAYTADLWHGLLPYCGMIDFTHEKAAEWFKAKISAVLSEGVDVLKTDFAEDIPFDAVFHNKMTGSKMRNIYSRLYNKAVFEAVEMTKGKGNGIVWARSGCAGMQQFPVCWSGDPYSSFEGMAGTLRGGLSLAMSGVPFWSHDMGGFYGDVSEETYIRWCQFGLFCSHSRLHGTTTRQPWAYGERAEKIVTSFIKLRYRLMPYILKTAKECVGQSVPFIRPLVFEHEDDPSVYQIYDEYYFGKDIIAAPVFGGDNASRKVYLPEGEWVDLLTDKVYEGKQWHIFRCPLEYMPVFAKKDSVIPMDLSDRQYIG